MEDAILSVLKGIVREKGDDDDAGKGKTIKVKSLRKMVLLSLRQDESDKSSKKEFKKAVQALHSDEKLVLNSEGLISPIIKKSKKRKSKDGVEEKLKKQKKGVDDVELKSKRKKKRVDSDKKQSQSSDSRATQTTAEGLDDEGNEEENEKEEAISAGGDASILKGVPCKGNPQGITRLFIGNLPFAVDEASLKAFIPGVTHIKWITDKESGAFYGSAFVEMETPIKAANAVAKSGDQLMSRPIKVNYAPARAGDIWPPSSISGNSSSTAKKSHNSGNGGQAGGSGLKAMSDKPPDCKKLFIGNLSYDIDDDAIIKFFGNVDAEVKAVRWLHHKDSGDFKGCGYVEFWNSEDCTKGAALNGKNILGRPIRIDWSD